jgi:hypothetical protein
MPAHMRKLDLRLARMLRPKNWPALETLRDVVHYISASPGTLGKERKWEHAVTALDRAAITGDERDIAAATNAVALALAEEPV